MDAIKPPPPEWLDRYYGRDVQALYTGRVSVTGGEAAHGRASGVVRSDDGSLQIELRLPEALGGQGGGSNPEQLLAAAYASCFHGAMTLLAMRAGIPLVDARLDVAVSFSRDPVDGLFVLSARVDVHLPGVDRALAAELIRNTERICPYAKLFQRGIDHVVALSPESASK